MTPTPQRQPDGRTYIEEEVAARALHPSLEDVRTTCSFARAERLLGREYHGRFLIELLQNAADAWRTDDRSLKRGSRMRVLVVDGPALLVANEGSPMTAEVVIGTLGHIGASTRTEGKSIGHKGIGFKSVLEVALGPEIYSGLQPGQPALAVGFDPLRARESIRQETPGWDKMLADVPGIDPKDDLDAIPLLRYPRWITDVPHEISELTDQGFDTVVRLPYDPRFTDRLRLEELGWLEAIRTALADVSDQIILLLGTFDEVLIEDRLADTSELVRPEWAKRTGLDGGNTREVVRITRNGDLSSRWIVHRRPVPELTDLAGEIAVGWRLSTTSQADLVPAVGGHPSSPFHLFFPTRIASGLPLLLHGYFEVDAARTSFYGGSKTRNQVILDGLGHLVADGMREAAAETGEVDLASIANLLAASGQPDDEVARAFRTEVMDLLDDVPWVPVVDVDGSLDSARPRDVFAWHPRLTDLVSLAFPPAYVEQRAGLRLPDSQLIDEAMMLISSRQPEGERDYWSVIAELCRPGDVLLWRQDEADSRFLALLDLFEALDVEDRSKTQSLLEALRMDPASRMLPTAQLGGGRAMLPIPDPAEGVRGQRSQLVMARARATSAVTLVPPPELDLAFLTDGLLANETVIDRAKPLGVRPFTVDNVLDRLNGIGSSDVDGPRLLGFLWSLLNRERVSPYGTVNSAKHADEFAPSKWFWCQPGRADDESKRPPQQRERYLADVPVPCRDGEWRAAGTVVFGQDWAEWLSEAEAGDPTAATQLRITAYRAMERIGPSDACFLASPEELLTLLPPELITHAAEGDSETEEAYDEGRHNAERHAFLLRLGVWEVPPIEAFENRERRERDAFPWSGPYRERQQTAIDATGGWAFGLNGWSGERHHNVWLAEDYGFAWSIEAAARRDIDSLVTALRLGSGLYGERRTARVFCGGCSDSGGGHTATRHSSADSGYPSTLALQLRHEPWLPCTLDGEKLKAPLSPETAWWHAKPPAGAGLQQSPMRLLPLCSPEVGVDERLRLLADLTTVEDASVPAIEMLLRSLRIQFDEGSLAVNPRNSGTARQAFTSLHRLVYDRLGELSTDETSATRDLLDEVGVLCELGESLVYTSRPEARHDDGRFSSYVRYFVGRVPLVVLPRDRDTTASRLRIEPLRITLARRGEDDGEDVTEQVSTMLGDRVAELLAIIVHHSLGTQTLELASNQFEERARRLQALTVRRVENLVIDAAVADTPHNVTIGEGTDHDVFLENPTSVRPVLYHDLAGDGWQDRLRRKIAPHLAAVLENPSYTHTFALFLQEDSVAEREEFLLELGISSDELEAVLARIGVVGEAEKQRHLRWFTAILHARKANTAGLDLDPLRLRQRLIDAGFDDPLAQRLVEIGGGEAVRREAQPESALWCLATADLEPRLINEELIALGDSGLVLDVTRRAFDRWLDEHARRLAAVLASRRPDDEAKVAVEQLRPPAELLLDLAPGLADVLAPVSVLLRSAGFEPDADLLADSPINELARLGGFSSAETLDEQVLQLFDEEERSRLLGERAAQWRRIIRLIAVLARTGPADTRSRIRTLDANVHDQMPVNPEKPSDLLPAMSKLLSQHPALSEAIAAHVSDSISAPAPQKESILVLAEAHGIAVDHLPKVDSALDGPRIEQAGEIRKRAAQLTSSGVRPAMPPELRPASEPEPRPPQERKRVPLIKVPESHDRRKRELGAEGEQWALAAVIGELIAMDRSDRARAIEGIVDLLGLFEGPSVEAVLAYAAPARSPYLDEDDLTDELTGLLHVSRHSDAFGFDMLGWLREAEDREPRAMCLEVKSSGGEEFHLTRSEWAVAKRFHDAGEGNRYAVLVVRRANQRGVPSVMDLLVDPVGLVNTGKLRQAADGYTMAYRTA